MQKQALKQSSSTDNVRLKINFAPVLVKHAQELRKAARGDADEVGKLVDIPEDRELFSILPDGRKVYRQNWRWAEVDEHGTEREIADFVDEEGNNIDDPMSVGTQILAHAPESDGYGKSAALKSNLAPALIKHAQELRKDANGLKYTNATPGSPEAIYNHNVSLLALSALTGLTAGGAASLWKAIKRPNVNELAIPRASTNLPLSLSFTQRKKTRRRKPEEEEDSIRHEKAAQETDDPGILGSPLWGSAAAWPSAAALGLTGLYSGMGIGDYIAAKLRKRLRKEQLQDAKDVYNAALVEQFAAGNQKLEEDEKSASADEGPAAEFDRVYDGLVKLARNQNRPPFKLDASREHSENLFNNYNNPVKMPGGKLVGWGAGILAAIAMIAGIPIGHMTYKAVRKSPGQRGLLAEAMRRRKSELARRQPQAIHLTPGEVEEVEEDGPITGSAI